MTGRKATCLMLAPTIILIMGLALFGCGKAQSKPVISAITPDSGPVGSEVVVSGGSFGAAEGTGTVHFGDYLAEVLSWSDVSITVTVPPSLVVAEYGVTVQTQAGASKEAMFTVNEAPKPSLVPKIASIKPASGRPGTEIVISGDNFGKAQGGGKILFGPGEAPVKAWSDTSITFTVPEDAKTNTYGVKVETPDGKSNEAILKVTRPEDLAAQKKAIVDYMGSHGMETQGSDKWVVEFVKQSASDPSWEVLKVTKPDGISFQALLINNNMLGGWECLSTEGPPWNGVEFKGEPVPSDLKNI